ncbi:hypothetical protein [Roseiterribacter gracilis]|uniref:Uncharacterized protein n=1 Tax=Roseiterribacter gracilis TaxID=2812848 RepID=A0A8S8X6I7_9PROT|nr:hypothetical protein TMPK1_10550 [Rhodospirillales bacterium TMPK1]
MTRTSLPFLAVLALSSLPAIAAPAPDPVCSKVDAPCTTRLKLEDNRLALVTSATGARLELDGRLLAETEGGTTWFHKPVPRRAKQILIAKSVETGACKRAHYLLDLAEPEAPKLTPALGDCATPPSKISRDRASGGLRIEFAGGKQFLYREHVLYALEDGKERAVGPAVATAKF